MTSGASRLRGAGLAGVPQIVAPGAADMVDFAAWDAMPSSLAGRSVHVHNRLIASATSPASLRKTIAKEIVLRLNQATGPTALLMPLHGVEAWDRTGEPLCDPEGLAAFCNEMRKACPANVRLVELDAHINDPGFAAAALAIVDQWIAEGRLG